jgi:uncharacterized NAD(P)/FAD-binding protein YdhS
MTASLQARGHRGRVLAVSRHGLLPRPRSPNAGEPFGDFVETPSRRISELLRRVRAAIAENQGRGRPWDEVLDTVRLQGWSVWEALAPDERLRFLRHVRPYWDAHRYQCAPLIDDLLRKAIAAGTLSVIGASVRAVRPSANGFLVDLLPRGGRDRAAVVTRWFGAILNCTGPSRRPLETNPVLASLTRSGLLRADRYGLGVEVDRQSRAVGSDGKAAPNLLVVGPLARGTFGELMGVPAISLQARDVAAAAALWMAEGSSLRWPAARGFSERYRDGDPDAGEAMSWR